MDASHADADDNRDHLVRRKPLRASDRGTYAAVTGHDDHQRSSETPPVSTREALPSFSPAATEEAKETSGGGGRPTPVTRRGESSGTPRVRQWYPEILWCLVSILLFGAIVGILAWRNNKPLPNWYGNLTVNTLIALLATVCRAATVVPISEGISQLKWNRLAQGSHPLRDVEVFNQASRGPWGSLRMVLTTRGHVYATMAALILVSGLATSTFTQSAIVLETRHVSLSGEGNATTNRLRTTPRDRVELELDSISAFSEDMLRAGGQAVFGPRDEVWPAPTAPLCTTSECRWKPFSSLGACMSLRNATGDLNITKASDDDDDDDEMTAQLPSGNYLTTSMDDFNLLYKEKGLPLAFNMSAPTGNVSDWNKAIFKNDDAMFNMTFMYLVVITQEMDDWAAAKFHALELATYYCVQTHDMQVAAGVLNTTSHGHLEVLRSGSEDERDESESKSESLYAILGSADGTEEFTVWPHYHELYGWFSNMFIGARPSKDRYEYSAQIMDRLGHDLKGYSQRAQSLPSDAGEKIWKSASTLGDSFAMALTNMMLQHGEAVAGEALTPVVFIRVEWAWLAFLGAQILLSIGFLGAIIAQTASLGVLVVKSSEVASLFAVGNYTSVSPDDPGIVSCGLRQHLDKGVRGKLMADEEGRWTLALDDEGPHGAVRDIR